MTRCRPHSRQPSQSPIRCGHDPAGLRSALCRDSVRNGYALSRCVAPRCRKPTHEPPLCARSVPKAALARPLPTRQTRQKGRLNFLYPTTISAVSSAARPSCGGSALRRFWHPDLLAVSRRRERRPSSRAAARHRARASAAQRDRNGGRTTCRGSGDGSCRARWAVRLCCCPADHASGVSGPTRSNSLRNRGKGDTLSEHADDHRLSRCDDTNQGRAAERSELALRPRRPFAMRQLRPSALGR